MKTLRLVIFVFGIVQGVFFRYTTRKVARGLELTGFVINMPDGSVKIIAEGPEDNLNELLDFAKKGPKLAKVDSVSHEFLPPTHQFSDFDYDF